MASSIVSALQPMSVKDIVAKAQDFDFNPHIPLKYWIRTADSLLREASAAQIYEHEDNDQQAYFLLMRYATLVADKLSEHPEAKEPEGKRALKAARSSIPAVIDRLEILKPAIEARYDTWQTTLKRTRKASAVSDAQMAIRRASFEAARYDPAVAGSRRTLAAAEHGDLAVRLADKEIRRRDAARKATRQAGISQEEEQERRTAGVWDNWEAALTNGDGLPPGHDSQQRMEETRRRAEAQLHESAPTPGSNDFDRSGTMNKHHRQSIGMKASNDYKYPTITKSHETLVDPPPTGHRPRQEIVPTRPSKTSLDENTLTPIRPTKEPLAAEPPPHEPSVPADIAGEEKEAFTFRPAAYLENGSPLRTVFLPPNLREVFLSLAASNTRNNLETCGILCGTLISNALFISRLVIPEQESTSDTCETVNESGLFDYCDSEDLMVLGWIHTHPTQTCFMSSRDLHTHCGYQVMMPESIAIVCAPSKTPSWGVFRLTDPPGMRSILQCRQTGLFHPHAETHIYTEALRPGHVFEAKGMEFQVVDLRPGRK